MPRTTLRPLAIAAALVAVSGGVSAPAATAAPAETCESLPAIPDVQRQAEVTRAEVFWADYVRWRHAQCVGAWRPVSGSHFKTSDPTTSNAVAAGSPATTPIATPSTSESGSAQSSPSPNLTPAAPPATPAAPVAEPTAAPAPHTTLAPTPTATPLAASLAEQAGAVVRLLNEARAENGLPALTVDSCLADQAATPWAQHMADTGAFEHASMKDVMVACPNNKVVGENIAFGQATAAQVHKDWMNSPGHRANILGADFTRIGVGIAVDASGKTYWVQNFGG